MGKTIHGQISHNLEGGRCNLTDKIDDQVINIYIFPPL